MSIIDPTEKKDFENVIRAAEYKVEDFELSEKTPPPPKGIFKEPSPPQGVFAETQHIAIKYKKTGVERVYAAGHESTWVSDFAADLSAGEFD